MRSTMVFMLIVVAIFLGYQQFFMKPQQEQKQAQQTQQQAATQQAATESQPPATVAPAAPAVATPEISAATETKTVVENALYKIVFTNRGGQVEHWYLKDYYDSGGKKGGHNLDLVQPQAAARFGQPLSLFTYEPALTTKLNQSLYQVTADGGQPVSGEVAAPGALTYHYSAGGLDVVKTFRFDATYAITVETQVRRNGAPVRALVEWPAGLGDMEEFQQTSMMPSQTRTPSFFAWSMGGKADTLAAAKVSGNNTQEAPYEYASVMDLYFATAFLPDVPERTTVVTLHNTIDLPSNPSDPSSKKTPADVLGLAVGDTSGYTRLRLFAGPKATDILSAVHATSPSGKADGPSLDSLIQFGAWLGIIAKPLYLILRFMILKGVPNWGWAIISFTIVFNLLLLPSRLMMTKQSLKMMRIQPKQDAIKKRYVHLKPTDPKRAEMNAELMELYKTEGVNMYGSCLPMLLQMPFFFAYFRVLQNAVELRQSHWYWLPDLSQPDPTFILPICVIITMFFTQYITPSPGMDPAQRRMMAIMMPVFFGFMLWHYPSGLALYWFTGNLMMLTMQIAINRSHIGREMHEIAARRAAKGKR